MKRCPAERRDGERRGIELCEFEFRERGRQQRRKTVR